MRAETAQRYREGSGWLGMRLGRHRAQAYIMVCISAIALAGCHTGSGSDAARERATLYRSYPMAHVGEPATRTLVAMLVVSSSTYAKDALPAGGSASRASRQGAKRYKKEGTKPAEKAVPKTPYGQKARDYVLTFSEEFNSYNTNIWNDHIWYEDANPTRNYTVEDGKLKIWPQRDASGNFFNRTIDTDGKYYQTYGYFEIEAKLPIGKGTWPAFWLFNHIGNRRPEIDIMEAYTGGITPWGFIAEDGQPHPRAYGATVWIDEGVRAGTRQYDTGMDLSAGFHKYAVKWEPHRQTFYFDGKEVLKLNVGMPDPMYVVLDLWFGGDSGTPDESTPEGKSNAFQINYVRAWQFRQ